MSKKNYDNLLIGILLWKEHGVDVWQDSALGNGDVGKHPAQLFVVSDGELDVSRDDPAFLVAFAAFPASSSTSAQRYSITAVI